MALNTRLANAVRSLMVDGFTAQANSGKLRIYQGTQPTNPDTGIGASTLLAELTLNATAFGAASNGVATANAITDDSAADATGTAQWFRVWKSDGTTPLWDGEVGTSGCNLNLNSTAIQIGVRVSITSFTFTQPMQGA